jgi:hypothetical protein
MFLLPVRKLTDPQFEQMASDLIECCNFDYHPCTLEGERNMRQFQKLHQQKSLNLASKRRYLQQYLKQKRTQLVFLKFLFGEMIDAHSKDNLFECYEYAQKELEKTIMCIRNFSHEVQDGDAYLGKV